jgi:2-dehydropantoate 2-reductase
MGSMIGNALCRTGIEITLIDRPQRLNQITSMGGLVVIDPEGHECRSNPTLLTSQPVNAGAHDVVILAAKSQDLAKIAPMVPDLSDESSCVVTIQNGIPWWYFVNIDHELRGTRLRSLDPDGSLEQHIDSSQIIGCIAYPAAELMGDGRVQHVEGNRFPVGEIDDQPRDRTQRLMQMFVDAGFKSRVLGDVRSEIWLKAWGALSINPLSAITHATMAEICSFEPTRQLVATMMLEAQAIAERLGATFRHTIERRIEGARAVGHHKTSMLQDLENGRPMELDALMLAVLEMAELVRIDAPAIRNVYACAALINESLLSSGGAGGKTTN